MIVIKNTESLCPQCYKRIGAEIIERDNSVWMRKTCSEHGYFEGLVDRDVNFYKSTYNSINDSNEWHFYLIPVTYKCNQKCSFCYVPRRDKTDHSIKWLLESIDKATSRWSIHSLVLTGGEPTLRSDLSELVFLLRRKYPYMEILLNTNGMVLSEQYVKVLRDRGLSTVNISFSSFRESDYQIFDDATPNVLSKKLQSLQSLKNTGMRTIISPTLVRNVNDGELGKICEFALNNLDFVEEIRIRNASMVGRCKEVDSLTLSELVSLTTKALGKDGGFFKMSEDLYHSNLGFGVALIINKGKIVDCLYGEYSRKNDHDTGVIVRIFLRGLWSLLIKGKLHSMVNYSILFKDLILQDPINKPNESGEKVRNFLHFVDLDFLRIRIWHWFDAMTIDLQEEKTGGGLHLMYDGSTIDACEAGMVRFEDI